ncbi:hypothetical protein ACFYXH_35900 [Streptomyces sp. NPDC002730]|uniref:hypothetical protein n=1 Tax=Streptomyces sp. NPDC002730 TaxID=3364662 RepID=UPI0036B560A3
MPPLTTPNTDYRYQLLASWADHALAVLARHSTDSAEQVAARCLRPSYDGKLL